MLAAGLAACESARGPTAPAATASPTVKPPPPRPEAAARPVAPEPPPPAPGELTGLSREQTIALLGHPASETPQAMGTVWRYRKGSCHLALVLYPEVETNVERVLSYEFTQGSDPAACLKRLRRSGGPNGR
jgi:hypothetical protein